MTVAPPVLLLFKESLAVTPLLGAAFGLSAGLDDLSLAVTLLLEAALELATLLLSLLSLAFTENIIIAIYTLKIMH